MIVDTPHQAHLERVRKITILIGAVGLLRMVPEAVSMQGGLDGVYVGLLVIDFFLLLMTTGVGLYLMDASSGMRSPALFLWGMLSASAVVLGNGLAERLTPRLFTSSGGTLALLYAPRLALYGVTCLATPYALWVLGFETWDRPTLVKRMGWFGAGLLIGGVVSFGVVPQRVW